MRACACGIVRVWACAGKWALCGRVGDGQGLKTESCTTLSHALHGVEETFSNTYQYEAWRLVRECAGACAGAGSGAHGARTKSAPDHHMRGQPNQPHEISEPRAAPCAHTRRCRPLSTVRRALTPPASCAGRGTTLDACLDANSRIRFAAQRAAAREEAAFLATSAAATCPHRRHLPAPLGQGRSIS